MKQKQGSRKRSSLKDKYRQQRGMSNQRKIPFLLSFEQWLKIWTDSGHLHERGRKAGQYVMARFGDKGPYAIDNVEIVTAAKNGSDGHKGKKRGPMSAEQRAKISKARKGRKFGPLSEEHKRHIGEGIKRLPPRSKEWRENIRKSRMGRRWPEEQRLRISKNWHEKRRGKVKNQYGGILE